MLLPLFEIEWNRNKKKISSCGNDQRQRYYTTPLHRHQWQLKLGKIFSVWRRAAGPCWCISLLPLVPSSWLSSILTHSRSESTLSEHFKTNISPVLKRCCCTLVRYEKQVMYKFGSKLFFCDFFFNKFRQIIVTRLMSQMFLAPKLFLWNRRNLHNYTFHSSEFTH